jgi:hypothetical protein
MDRAVVLELTFTRRGLRVHVRRLTPASTRRTRILYDAISLDALFLSRIFGGDRAAGGAGSGIEDLLQQRAIFSARGEAVGKLARIEVVYRAAVNPGYFVMNPGNRGT